MIYTFPIFENVRIRMFQGIDDISLKFDKPETALYIEPMTGKSSFINGLSFLFFGDVRLFDNRYAIQYIPYSRALTLIFNSESQSIEDLLLENEYLKVTATHDISFISKEDLYTINDYPVRVIFKRIVNLSKIKEHGGVGCILGNVDETKDETMIDYSYLCYDEDKYAFNTKFNPIFNFFENKKFDRSTYFAKLYNTLQILIPNIFKHEVYFNTQTNITIGKNGKLLPSPPLTIEMYVRLVSELLTNVDSTIVVDDIFGKLDQKMFTDIINSIRNLLYSFSSFKKVIYIVNSNESLEKFRSIPNIDLKSLR